MLAGGGEVIVDARTAEWEGEFSFVAIRKDRMKEMGRRKNRAFSQAKVKRQVGGVWMVEDGRMTGGIFSILNDPRIQARVVVVVDFFIVDGLVIQEDGVGSPSVKGVTWFEGCLEIQVGDEGGHVGNVFFHLVAVAFPHLDEPVPAGQ